MDRLANFGSGASLHRDEDESQSRSQVRPRPAIRLDSSLSFLHASSRVGSPRSGPASPTLTPPPAMFASRDVNVSDAHKSRSGPPRCREVSGSLQAKSLSLSLGSSRVHSQQQHRAPPLPSRSSTRSQLFSDAEVEDDDGPASGEARVRRDFHPRKGSTTAAIAAAAVLDSEATQLTQPYESADAAHDSRSTSPAPRMAVTLPDDYANDFEGASSNVVAAGTARSAAFDDEGEESMRRRAVPCRNGGDGGNGNGSGSDNGDLVREKSINGQGDTTTLTNRATRASEAPLFSRGLRWSRYAGDEEGSRTSTATPPPRRAFVLSRRCSADPATSPVVEEVEEAVLEVVDREEEKKAGEGAVVEPAAENANVSSEVKKKKAEERVDAEPTLPESDLLQSCIVEEEAAEKAHQVNTWRDDALAQHPTAALSAINATQDGFAAEMTSFIVRESTELRLSDGAGDSRRSSMMSPLPRPVSAVTQRDAAAAACGPPRISPAHSREEEREGACRTEEGATRARERERETVSTTCEGITATTTTTTTTTAATVAVEPGDHVADTVAADTTQNPHELLVTATAANDMAASRKASPSVKHVEVSDSLTALNSATTTTTTPTITTRTTMTAASSLWLVNGPTPTPLRRLRGDCNDKDDDEEKNSLEKATTTMAGKDEASPTVETESEEEVDKTARPISLKDATSSHATSPLHSAALSLVSDSGEVTHGRKAGEGSATQLPSPQQRQHDPRLSPPHVYDGDSCSPEPQRPPEPAEKAGEAALLTESISPVTSLDRKAQRHPQHTNVNYQPHDNRHHQLEVKEVETMPLNSIHTAADAFHTKTREELGLMQPSSSAFSSTTPVRSSYTEHHGHHSCSGHLCDAAMPATEQGVTPPAPSHITTSNNNNNTLALTPTSPSATLSESARVSEEVRELVERAHAEVRRTRASLLATLHDCRVDFDLVDRTTSPAPPLASADDAVAFSSTTPTRSLVLPHVTTTTTTAATGATGSPSLDPMPACAATSSSSHRTSGELRAAATALRPQLAEAANAILRRLQGYDARGHGVLPMETVVRVAYFVVARQRMPVATWTLRTAEGSIATTPMRASMVEQSAVWRSAERRRAPQTTTATMTAAAAAAAAGATPTATPRTARHLAMPYWDDARHGLSGAKAYATPHGQRLSDDDHNNSCYSTQSGVHALVGAKRGRGEELTPTHRTSEGAKTTEADVSGRPATLMSPSRTLEQVMARQEQRAEEERYLNFYFTVLEAFKQVFGERYAWRHLGATNASRHDNKGNSRSGVGCNAVKRARGEGTAINAGEIADVSLDVENELNDVSGPLETVFPRLRQHYALNHGEGVTTPGMGLTQRPPPLDVLVRYRTFTDSLREL